MENDKNKKSVKFQGDMLNFCDFTQVFVFTTNHHLKFKISTKTSRGTKDSTKDTIIDTTSDSQVNSNFPNRWSPASLTFNNYFYLFLYLYIT